MHWHLRQALALQNVLIATLPLIAITIFTITWIVPQMRTKVEAGHQAIARVVATQVEAYLLGAQRDLSSLLAHLQYRGKLDTPSWQHNLDAHASSADIFSNIILTDERGIVTAVGLPAGSMSGHENYLGVDISRRRFYQVAKQKNEPVWSNSFLSAMSGQLSVAIAIPVGDRLLVGEIDLGQLSQFINNISDASQLTTMLIDANRVLVAHTRADLTGQQLNLGNLPIIKKGFSGQTGVQQFEFAGEKLVGTAVPVARPGWLILVAQSPESAYWQLRLAGGAMAVAVIVALLASIAAGLLIAHREARRTARYEDNARRIAHGEFDMQWPRSRIVEFARLGGHLQQMAEAIQRREQELLDRTTELQKYQDTLEDRVQRRTAELKHANRELEAFSYSVSHDLRAPLRSMDGFSSILLEEYADKLDDTARDYIYRIKRGSIRMAQLIDDILQLSRINRLKMDLQLINLSALAERELTTMQQEENERNVRVMIKPTPDVKADPKLLSIALTNLLQNAWKYTGTVADPCIEFGSIYDDRQTIFYVKDNGVGFDMAYADKLFGAFQRLHRAEDFPGSGIGLATVKRVLSRHGGRIWAEAAPGQGAIFYFTVSDR